MSSFMSCWPACLTRKTLLRRGITKRVKRSEEL